MGKKLTFMLFFIFVSFRFVRSYRVYFFEYFVRAFRRPVQDHSSLSFSIRVEQHVKKEEIFFDSRGLPGGEGGGVNGGGISVLAIPATADKTIILYIIACVYMRRRPSFLFGAINFGAPRERKVDFIITYACLRMCVCLYSNFVFYQNVLANSTDRNSQT